MVKKKRVAKAEQEDTFDHNGFGIVGVVLGILGILFIGLQGVILGIIGLVFSRKQEKIGKNKWSKAGKTLNWIAIILGIIVTIVAIVVFSNQVGTLGLEGY